MRVHIRLALATTFLLAGVVSGTPPAAAQESRRSLDIGINKTGISIGDSREWRGIRLNVRDTRLERVAGINATIWSPRNDAAGDIRGLSLGLPLTGGRNVRGISVGVFGTGATEEISGLGIGGLGIGAGSNARGIFVGGLGAGVGAGLRGIAIGGLGVGAGQDARGILIGGLGAGLGGDFNGLGIGGIGIGAGGDATGVMIGGIGVGAGGTIKYLSIGGIGIGASRVEGLAIGGIGIGGQDLAGVMIAGGAIRVMPEGSIRGVAVSTMNHVRGGHSGLAIGIVNYTWSLNGVQLGVVNIVRNNPRGRRVLPIVNWGSGE